MKILDFCLNEYPSLKKATEHEETKNLPVFIKNPPNDFYGFYLKECKTEVRIIGESEWKPAIFYQLRQKLID